MISLTKNQVHFRNEKVSDDPFKKAVQLNSYNNIVKENISEQYNRYSREKQRKEEIMGITSISRKNQV